MPTITQQIKMINSVTPSVSAAERRLDRACENMSRLPNNAEAMQDLMLAQIHIAHCKEKLGNLKSKLAMEARKDCE